MLDDLHGMVNVGITPSCTLHAQPHDYASPDIHPLTSHKSGHCGLYSRLEVTRDIVKYLCLTSRWECVKVILFKV